MYEQAHNDSKDNPVLVHTIECGSNHNIHIDADGFLYVIYSAENVFGYGTGAQKLFLTNKDYLIKKVFI